MTTDTAGTDHPHHCQTQVVIRVPGDQGTPAVSLTGVPPSLVMTSTDLTVCDEVRQLTTLFPQDRHTHMAEVLGEAAIEVISETPARHHGALPSVDLA